MLMSWVAVEPKLISKSVVRVQIEVTQYVINDYAMCTVLMCDENDNTIETRYVIINNEDFMEKWVTDDDLIDLVLQKLNLNEQ